MIPLPRAVTASPHKMNPSHPSLWGPRLRSQPPTPMDPPRNLNQSSRSLDLNLSREKTLVTRLFFRFIGRGPSVPPFFLGGRWHPSTTSSCWFQPSYISENIMRKLKLESIFPQGKGKNSKNMFQTTIQLKIYLSEMWPWPGVWKIRSGF